MPLISQSGGEKLAFYGGGMIYYHYIKAVKGENE